jgi:uncharacterized protein
MEKESAMNRAALTLLPAAALLAALAVPARQASAQPAPTAPATAPATASNAAETVLTLSETAEVSRAPDELRAVLRATARGNEAAGVQAQVNRAIEAALARAKETQGVRATTGGYWTDRDNQSRQWNASQQITLQGREAAPLLELAGALQGQGLALAGLDWSLSRDVAQAARQEAGRMAIEALRQRAAAVAQQLGMQVAGIRSLRLDAPEPPAPRMAMMRAAPSGVSSATPPSSVPEEVNVSSTAVAEVVLRAN